MNRFRSGFKPVGTAFFFLFFLFTISGGKSIRAESDRFMRIRQEAKNIKSLQADFVQQKQMKILVKPLISKGRFFFKQPASIRWEYLTPFKSVVMMHQGEVRRFFKKNGKVVRDSGASLQAMQVVMQNITHWLGGRFDKNSDFKMVVKKDRILLIPSKPMPGMIDRVELLLSTQPGIIESITIYEDKENYTKIEFKSLEINRPIADSVFQEIS